MLSMSEMRKMGKLREAIATQKQVQLEFWQEQGLSEEEINQKIEDWESGETQKAFRQSIGFKAMIFVGSIVGVDETNHPPMNR